MDLVSVLVAGIIGLMAVMGTFQGLASAMQSQALLKHKTDLVIESQGVNNVLSDPAACALSQGKQIIYYNNGQTAYSAGDGTVSSYAWSTQGSTTVLTIASNYTYLKPVVLNLNCTASTSSTTNTASTTSTSASSANVQNTTNTSTGTNTNTNNSNQGSTSVRPCN